MKKNPNEMNAAELKKLAKEMGIKNWWTMKKAELQTAISDTLIKTTTKTEPVTDRINDELVTAKYEKMTLKQLKSEMKKMTKAGIIFGDEYDYLNNLIKSEAHKVHEDKMTIKPDKPAKTEKAKSQKDVDPNIITLKELIPSGMKGTKARRLLRNGNINRPFTQWEWNKVDHADIIKQVKELLK